LQGVNVVLLTIVDGYGRSREVRGDSHQPAVASLPHERRVRPCLDQYRPARIRTRCNGTNVRKSKCIYALLKLLFKIKIRMSHTHVAVQTPRLLCESSLRYDRGTFESRSRPKAFRTLVLRERLPMLLLT